MNDPHDLQRFIDAQSGLFDQALAELRAGRKRGHWMWFIFPQVAGLGRSETARRFAIASRREAQAYLDHAILGPRLLDCTRAVCRAEGRSAYEIFGSPDDLKFRSSMTLFAEVAGDNGIVVAHPPPSKTAIPAARSNWLLQHSETDRESNREQSGIC
jgi:uncharacterized protein (DUF1810 family)